MENLKEKISKISLVLRDVSKRFPITVGTVILLTLIFALNNAFDIITSRTLSNIAMFGTTFAYGTLLIESILNDRKNKIVYYSISAIIAFVFTFAIRKDIFPELIWRIYICYMISIFALSIFFNYKNNKNTSNCSFNEYSMSIFINIFKATLVYLILAIGVAMVTTVFAFLILEGKSYKIIIVSEILILGIYYIPNLIYSIYNLEHDTKTKFSKFVVKYVFETLVIISFAIIYMYILKIIITGQMPSNQIFRILATLFILGFPIWTMTKAFDENTIIDKINKWLPALFIPFIILQTYSIGVRILNYGITESRYMCVMLIIFEIIYTIIYFKQNDKIENIILAFVALTIISTVIPFVNMYKVSEYSQIHNLNLIRKEIYTDSDKTKIVGAYNYLKRNSKYINSLEEGELNKILSLVENKNKDKYMTSSNEKYISLNASVNQLNIEGYKKLYKITANEYNISSKNVNDIFSKLLITLKDNNSSYYEEEKRYINIINIVNEYIKNEKTMSETELNSKFKTTNEIELNDRQKLIIQDLSFSFDTITQEVSTYRLTGYLLEK